MRKVSFVKEPSEKSILYNKDLIYVSEPDMYIYIDM